MLYTNDGQHSINKSSEEEDRGVEPLTDGRSKHTKVKTSNFLLDCSHLEVCPILVEDGCKDDWEGHENAEHGD